MRILKFITISASLITAAAAADFFPLKTGNTWTYQNHSTGQTFTVSVGTPVVSHDQVYYSLSGFTPSRILVRINDNKDLVQIDEETGREQIVTSFTPFEGGWWNAPARGCDTMGQTKVRRGEHNGPAGVFHEILEIAFRVFSCADTGDEAEQYAENIGMVRRVTSSIAGPQQFDLVYARVGSLRIQASRSGLFSVSVDVGANELTAILRLETNATQPINLQFSTSQEYDLILRDGEGKALWKWSDGQFFTTGGHTRSISPGWSATVRIPRPSAAGPGQINYTLEAWLTTAGSNPAFAVSVPVSWPVEAAVHASRR